MSISIADIESKIIHIEHELEQLRARNKRVEADKRWEVSTARTLCIVTLTYLVTAMVFVLIHASDPLLNAFVPTVGYLLSTRSLSLCRKVFFRMH